MTEPNLPAPGGLPHPRRGRRLPTLLAAAAVILVIGGLTWWLARPDPTGPTTTTIGEPDAERLTAPADPTSATATPPSNPAPTTTAEVGGPARTSPAQPPGSRGSDQPVRLELPSLNLTAPVVPVGVDPAGLMTIPPDVRTVGWYRFGPAPGSPAGSAVFSGHVNDRVQGTGVFARIGELQIGQTVTVRLADGRKLDYRIIAREQWAKDQVPLARLFDRAGQPRIVLITCGGVFDRASRNYQDNIAVTAVPTEAP